MKIYLQIEILLIVSNNWINILVFVNFTKIFIPENPEGIFCVCVFKENLSR
jgi:hypothetical protein